MPREQTHKKGAESEIEHRCRVADLREGCRYRDQAGPTKGGGSRHTAGDWSRCSSPLVLRIKGKWKPINVALEERK